MQSLRRTLSVRFSFTMFVALFVIALWAFLATQRILRRELDRGLAAIGHLQTAVIAAGLDLPAEEPVPGSGPIPFEVNRVVVLRDADGSVVGANRGIGRALPFDSAALARAGREGQAWGTQSWDGQPYRSVYVNVAHDRAGDHRVVQVAAAMAPLESEARQVFLLMLGTVALGTVAASLGAGWLSRSTTAPVAEITAQAEAIEPGAVGQRITAHAQVEEFNRLVGVLNSMLEGLDRGLLAQRRIIADVGHDLRTPLTAMQGELEVTLRHPRDPTHYQRVLRSVLEETNHLATISETLLLLARIETGELVPRRARTDLGSLVERAVGRIRQRVADHPVTDAAGTADVGEADVDPNMIGLVLDHLLDNAVRHTPPDTPVRAEIRADRDEVAVTIADEGPGVPPDMLSHLFERFYRGDSARGRGGAGLGLTVAAAIVQVHGGTIRAEHASPSGLRVTVVLPRQVPAARTA